MFLQKGLNRNRRERLLHIEELKKVIEDKDHFPMLCFLYDNLSVIDEKSASLLQFNSILIAALTIIAKISILEAGIIIIFLISSILALYTVFVHWSTTEDFHSEEKHICKLLEIRDRRTLIYRLSWWLSIIGLISFIGLLVADVIGRVKK